jgi:hypothetical protein
VAPQALKFGLRVSLQPGVGRASTGLNLNLHASR